MAHVEPKTRNFTFITVISIVPSFLYTADSFCGVLELMTLYPNIRTRTDDLVVTILLFSYR